MPAVTPIPGAESGCWASPTRGTLLPVVDPQFLEGERTVIHESQRVLAVRQSGGDVAVTIDELFNGQRSFVEAQGVDLDGGGWPLRAFHRSCLPRERPGLGRFQPRSA